MEHCLERNAREDLKRKGFLPQNLQGGSEKGIGTFDMMRRGLPGWVSDERLLMRYFYEN